MARTRAIDHARRLPLCQCRTRIHMQCNTQPHPQCRHTNQPQSRARPRTQGSYASSSHTGPRLDIRSFGSGTGSGGATATFSTLGPTSLRTSGGGDGGTRTAGRSRARKSATQEEVLISVLDDMRLASPPVPFARNYLLLNERASGGQGIVQVRARLCSCISWRVLLSLIRRADGAHAYRVPCVAAAAALTLQSTMRSLRLPRCRVHALSCVRSRAARSAHVCSRACKEEPVAARV